MKRCIAILVVIASVLAASHAAGAQTTATTIAWDYDVPTTEVATYVQSVTLDNVVLPGPPVCVAKIGAPTQTTCTIPTPAPLAPGSTHTISVTGAKNGITAQTTITGLSTATMPHNASAPRVTVTITVTVP